MMGWGTRISPEVRSFLEAEREVPALPASVRARAMARASAALSAFPAVTLAPETTSSPARGLRFSLAAGIVAASLTAIGAGAFALVKRFEPAPEPDVVHQVDAVAARATTGKVAPLVAEAAQVPPSSPVSEESPSALHVRSVRGRGAHVAVSHDEVVLLQRARAAVARKDFAGALHPLSAHARRFKDGRLAEEREALRVKALAGLGRTEDARETAAAFAAKFPRSPLLPVVEQVSGNQI